MKTKADWRRVNGAEGGGRVERGKGGSEVGGGVGGGWAGGGLQGGLAIQCNLRNFSLHCSGIAVTTLHSLGDLHTRGRHYDGKLSLQDRAPPPLCLSPCIPMSRPLHCCFFPLNSTWQLSWRVVSCWCTWRAGPAPTRPPCQNVRLFSLSPSLVFSLHLPLPYFWLNHQITVCLPSQVTVFLLRQAGSVPGLSLRFVNFCLVHLETNRREYGAAAATAGEKEAHTHILRHTRHKTKHAQTQAHEESVLFSRRLHP